MKVKILLSIGYVILFFLLGAKASQPITNLPAVIFMFILLTGSMGYMWLKNDTVSKGK